MGGVRATINRPVPPERLWPALTVIVGVVVVLGLGVTTLVAPPADASAVDLAFGLAPMIVWVGATVAIGRFVRAALARRPMPVDLASALLIAGGMLITGAFCALPYEFLLADGPGVADGPDGPGVAGVGFDVVLPMWVVGTLALVGSAVVYLLGRGGTRSPDPDPGAHGQAGER